MSGPSLVTLIGEKPVFPSFLSSSLLSQPTPSLSPSNPFGSSDPTLKFLFEISPQSRSRFSVSSTRGGDAFSVLKVNPKRLCPKAGSVVVVDDAKAGSVVVVDDAKAGSVVVVDDAKAGSVVVDQPESPPPESPPPESPPPESPPPESPPPESPPPESPPPESPPPESPPPESPPPSPSVVAYAS